MKAPQHPLAWVAPPPFWRPGVADADARATLAEPQILRFVSDEFIEELLGTLEREPAQLPRYTAQPETWRAPHAGPRPAPEVRLERPPQRLLPLLRRTAARQAVPALAPRALIPERPLKLYQAAHQRHYLVAGSLVCQAPGLPDRAIDPARQRVGFVVRRLLPNPPPPGVQPPPADQPLPTPTDRSAWTENAWVPVGEGGEWRPVGPANQEAAVARPLAGEERLAMFPARYTDARGQPRRLFVGSVPVGRREAYQAGEQRSAARSEAERTTLAYQTHFRTEVLAPWRTQVQQARAADGLAPQGIFLRARFNTNTNILDPAVRGQLTPTRVLPLAADIDADALRRLRDQLQMDSWYLLRDLMRFLLRYLPSYAAWLVRPQGAVPAGLEAFDAALRRVETPGELKTGDRAYTLTMANDLPAALGRLTDAEMTLLDNALSGTAGTAVKPFDSSGAGAAERALWPAFGFLFQDPVFDVPTPFTTAPVIGADDFETERIQARIDRLLEALPVALMASADPPPEPSLATRKPADLREGWYVMRLIHERPDCAPFEGPVTSRATAPFQLAGFFDPDAPARPIRIGLPLDISPSGLRKFDKNTVFMMSDMLCGHIDRFKGITFADLVLSVLPWPFHKPLSVPDKGPCKEGSTSLGVMCSLSIPIITICALILLMIIVALLDFIFRWLPLFIVCFPLPGFKGKK